MNEIARLVAGGILALVSAYLGYMVKSTFKEKVNFYKDMTALCDSFKRELSFSKPTLTAFLTGHIKDKKGKSADLVCEYLTALKEKGKFEKDLDKWDFAHLKRDEKQELLFFFNGLGTTALKEQLSHLDKCEMTFKSRQAQKEDELKKKGNMYFKLFVLFGIALLVILG